MPPHIRELCDLLIRWVHLIAGIMWIGNSLLFNWLDRNLLQPKDPRDKEAAAAGRLCGEIWMVHSGGFYQVEKKFLAPSEMPETLHWFKWQSYSTWMSGIALLILVYYLDGAALLVDTNVANLTAGEGMAVGLGLVFGGLLIYDGLWRLLGPRAPRLATVLSLLLGVGALALATRLLSGRAAYIHIGALLGTVMAGNVFLHIIPSQHGLLAATLAGKLQDPALSVRAKQRSIHNNYMTFPLLFIMISNHFASTYGNRHNAWVLAVLIVAGATVRHLLNIRFSYRPWGAWLALVIVSAVGVLYFMLRPPPAPPVQGSASYASVEPVIVQRCRPCHSQRPSDPQWPVAPNGVMFDTAAQVHAHAERIRVRAVLTKTMPFANKTGMTEEERAVLERWLNAGAPTE